MPVAVGKWTSLETFVTLLVRCTFTNGLRAMGLQVHSEGWVNNFLKEWAWEIWFSWARDTNPELISWVLFVAASSHK